jgi:uncharacterized membrane protein
MKKLLIAAAISISLFAPSLFVYAQSDATPQAPLEKATVVSVISTKMEDVPGTSVKGLDEMMMAKILEGGEKGKTVSLDDDYVSLAKGDTFYIQKNSDNTYSVGDVSRLPTLAIFASIFIILVLAVGGLQGLRGLLSLAGSFVLILYVLLPAILHGISPVLASILVSSFIIVLGSYITHGFNKTTTAAVVGMIITVIITGGFAYVAVHAGKLTGYESESALSLNINNGGSIDILGVLLGGIMIGLLGVLYDVAIGQAISVEELHHIAPHVSGRKIFSRALRIGREHIGALVNTLAIAYVGASLPLLLLFSQSSESAALLVNKEIFATEILRTLVGSIGLVLAVPITTLLAVILVTRKKQAERRDFIRDSKVVDDETEALERFEHRH